MGYHRFVVLGDSCAEGLDDPYPDQTQYRGWADFVADRLARLEPGFRYANLAVRGRRLDQIVPEQVPTATRLEPDLIALFGGGNDVMSRGWDARTVARRVDTAIRAWSYAATRVGSRPRATAPAGAGGTTAPAATSSPARAASTSGPTPPPPPTRVTSVRTGCICRNTAIGVSPGTSSTSSVSTSNASGSNRCQDSPDVQAGAPTCSG